MNLIPVPETKNRWAFYLETYQNIAVRGQITLTQGPDQDEYSVVVVIIGNWKIARSDPPFEIDEALSFECASLEEIPQKLQFALNGFISELSLKKDVLMKVRKEIDWDNLKFEL